MALTILSCLFALCTILQPVQSTTASSYDNSISSFIVNGIKAKISDWPWQMYIITKNSTGHDSTCAGTIINSCWVLTAAHCVNNMSNIKVYGCVRNASSEHVFSISEANVRIHPNYSRRKNAAHRNDIALVKLERNVQFSRCMRAVRLPNKTAGLGTKCIAIGWGNVGPNKPPPDYALRQVEINVRSPLDCLYNGFNRRRMICAGNATHGVYSGDSGGSLVCLDNDMYYEQGIAAASTKDGTGPQVFVRVTSYLDWIKTITNPDPTTNSIDCPDPDPTTNNIDCPDSDPTTNNIDCPEPDHTTKYIALGVVIGLLCLIVMLTICLCRNWRKRASAPI